MSSWLRLQPWQADRSRSWKNYPWNKLTNRLFFRHVPWSCRESGTFIAHNRTATATENLTPSYHPTRVIFVNSTRMVGAQEKIPIHLCHFPQSFHVIDCTDAGHTVGPKCPAYFGEELGRLDLSIVRKLIRSNGGTACIAWLAPVHVGELSRSDHFVTTALMKHTTWLVFWLSLNC